MSQLFNKLKVQQEAINSVARAAYERGYETGKQVGYKMKEQEIEEENLEAIEAENLEAQEYAAKAEWEKMRDYQSDYKNTLWNY